MKNVSFGQTLRKHRQAAGLTLQELAQYLGYSHVYLSAIERGRRPPLNPDTCVKLASRLGMPPEVLYNKAALERGRVQLPLVGKCAYTDNTALLLARNWGLLSKAQLNSIRLIVEGL